MVCPYEIIVDKDAQRATLHIWIEHRAGSFLPEVFMIFLVDLYEMPERYNHIIRATLPPCVRLEMHGHLPGASKTTVASPLTFDGDTREEAVAHCTGYLKARGYSGRLRIANA